MSSLPRRLRFPRRRGPNAGRRNSDVAAVGGRHLERPGGLAEESGVGRDVPRRGGLRPGPVVSRAGQGGASADFIRPGRPAARAKAVVRHRVGAGVSGDDAGRAGQGHRQSRHVGEPVLRGAGEGRRRRFRGGVQIRRRNTPPGQRAVAGAPEPGGEVGAAGPVPHVAGGAVFLRDAGRRRGPRPRRRRRPGDLRRLPDAAAGGRGEGAGGRGLLEGVAPGGWVRRPSWRSGTTGRSRT